MADYYVTLASGRVVQCSVAAEFDAAQAINSAHPGYQDYTDTPPQGWLDQVAAEQAAAQAAADARAQAEAAKAALIQDALTKVDIARQPAATLPQVKDAVYALMQALIPSN